MVRAEPTSARQRLGEPSEMFSLRLRVVYRRQRLHFDSFQSFDLRESEPLAIEPPILSRAYFERSKRSAPDVSRCKQQTSTPNRHPAESLKQIFPLTEPGAAILREDALVLLSLLRRRLPNVRRHTATWRTSRAVLGDRDVGDLHGHAVVAGLPRLCCPGGP